MMDNKNHTRQMGQASDKLLWLEQDLDQVKWNFDGAPRNRIVVGVILLIGLLTLIGFLVTGTQFISSIAAVSLFTSSLLFIRSLVTGGAAGHSSVNTLKAWQRIASYDSIPKMGAESGKMQEVIFYEPPTDRIADTTPS